MCDALLKLEKDSEEDEFWEVFLNHLRKSMILYKSEPSAEKIMQFVSVYATYQKRDKPEVCM